MEAMFLKDRARWVAAARHVLGAVPHDKICVTPCAALGFHAAYDFGVHGRIVTNPEATMMLYATYPTPVQHGSPHAVD